MGKKSKAPKGPNWKKLMSFAEGQAAQNQAMFDEYMAFSKQAYDDQKGINQQILDVQLPAMRAEAEFAQMMRDRYINMGLPFENEYLDKIKNWDTEGRRDERAGEAQAQIGQAAEAAREAELRRLEGFGIDPSQTRSAALDSRLRLGEAIAKAGAGNQQRRMVEQEGLQFGAQAVDIMRGYPGMSSQALGNAGAAGGMALQGQMAIDGARGSSYAQGSNMLGQGFNMMNSAYGTAGNLNQNDLQRHQMNIQNSPWAGIGQLAGIGIGAAGAAGGFPNLFMGSRAEGGPVYRAEGGGIPEPGAAPAAAPRPPGTGLPTDNVPTNLTPGEFVIPDDVARWEGEKSLQKMINKAREEKTKTDAQRRQNQMALGIPA
jgi:hypothetical protein